MTSFRRGGYVKVELRISWRARASGCAEVYTCNDEAGILFGELDSLPLMGADLRLGDGLAVSYDKVIEHRKASGFGKE